MSVIICKSVGQRNRKNKIIGKGQLRPTIEDHIVGTKTHPEVNDAIDGHLLGDNNGNSRLHICIETTTSVLSIL